jgi:L-iditol 2-dehydrogenase
MGTETAALSADLSAPIATMAAVVKTAPGAGNVTFMRVPEPQCGPGKVKIEVAFSGICGTDLHVYHDRFRNYPPVILGHEFSGVVTEVGAGVHSVHPGDRVTVLPASAVICGSCEYCRQGYYMFCPVRRGMGHGVNGSFTRFVVVREDQVYRLPPGLSLEEGALAEPLASAVQAVEELGEFRTGDTVLISGPGPIGLLCLLLLRHRTRTIVAGTASDVARLQLAGELGADVLVDVSREDLLAVVDRKTGGRGVDGALECAGAAASVTNCLQALGKLGRYVQLGIVGAEITVPFDLLLYKQIRLWGSVGYSARTWVRVMQILGQNKLDLSRLVTHKLPLSQWREGFDLCESKQAVKVLLYYDETGRQSCLSNRGQ